MERNLTCIKIFIGIENIINAVTPEAGGITIYVKNNIVNGTSVIHGESSDCMWVCLKKSFFSIRGGHLCLFHICIACKFYIYKFSR